MIALRRIDEDLPRKWYNALRAWGYNAKESAWDRHERLPLVENAKRIFLEEYGAEVVHPAPMADAARVSPQSGGSGESHSCGGDSGSEGSSSNGAQASREAPAWQRGGKAAVPGPTQGVPRTSPGLALRMNRREAHGPRRHGRAPPGIRGPAPRVNRGEAQGPRRREGGRARGTGPLPEARYPWTRRGRRDAGRDAEGRAQTVPPYAPTRQAEKGGAPGTRERGPPRRGRSGSGRAPRGMKTPATTANSGGEQ